MINEIRVHRNELLGEHSLKESFKIETSKLSNEMSKQTTSDHRLKVVFIDSQISSESKNIYQNNEVKF